MKLPKITLETIKNHEKEITKASKSKKFKSESNKIFGKIMKENPALSQIIIPTLESKKSDEYKKGYLAGFTTVYNLLRKEAKKQK
jgi:hypothetical protein